MAKNDQKNLTCARLLSYENLEAGFTWPIYSSEYSIWKTKSIIHKMLKEELTSLTSKSLEVLDVGCSKGIDLFMLSSLLKEFTDRVRFVGVDNVIERIEFANYLKELRGAVNCSFMVGFAEKLDFRSESFDVVLCSEVLEHLPEPERCLKEIYRVLKFRGVAIITTPNSDNIIKRMYPKGATTKFETEQQWCAQRHGGLASKLGHVSEKSLNYWKRLCNDNGLRIETVKRGSLTYGGPYIDRHPVLFALMLMIDSLFDHLHVCGASWDIILKLRK